VTQSPIPGPVHIIGSGLIGTSLGLALRRVGVDVTVADADETAMDTAISMGAGRLWRDGFPAPRIVVAAVPPSMVGDVLADAARRWPQATFTDVASVKTMTLAKARNAGVPPAQLVGGHPMAGREVSGPHGGRADLFDDRIWVLCPTEEAQPERVGEVSAMVAACGSVSILMTPGAHDAAVAVVSHTPQMLSSVLAAQLADQPEEVVTLAGQGIRDMTRIAESDEGLWEEIVLANRESVVTVLRSVAADIQRVVSELDGGGLPEQPGNSAVAATLRQGAVGRARIPGKHGDIGREFEVVSVMVKDEPGQLASLFVAAGDLGVNLEDVRIEHVLGRPSGLIDLSVRPASAPSLRAGLIEAGFDVRS
jgi:prephenate dehydrogenase